MKIRIVRELHRMSRREDDAYIRSLAVETGLHENNIPGIAREAMAHILHDYSHFSVVTIDSFFQKVIRAFAREMGLYAGYNVELDQSTVLDEAIDLMLDGLGENDYLKDWLVDWAKKKIEGGKSWNFKNDIHRLGHEIFSENLKKMDMELLGEITDKNRIESFGAKLDQMVSAYMEKLQSIGLHAMSVISAYGLTADDFVQKGRGVAGYFRKLSEGQNPVPNSYVQKALDDISGWCSKSSYRKNDVEQAYYNGLFDILQEAYLFQTDNAVQFASAQVVLKQLNVLGILSDLTHHVKEYARGQNLFLLSEASGFLKTIIAGTDAPFIYERVGSFYNHFMIDEFQDTSAIQWDNFRPLVVNSLGSGYADWIVGDVKQSIYRWRNTDWKILSEQVEYDLGKQNVSKQSLDTNWRSDPRVIHFNNAFFRAAVRHMCQAFMLDEEDAVAGEDYLSQLLTDMIRAYNDSYQELPEHKMGNTEGYVRLSMIPEEKDDEESWQEKVLNELPVQIEQLQDLGYSLSDIAVLVRENKEAQIIADMLLAYRQAHPDSGYRYDVLSNESLLIKNASSVKWLVAAMRYIVDPDDLINKAFLQYEYQHYLKPVNSQVVDVSGISREDLQQWRGLPVYELTDKLIQISGLFSNPEQAPFVQAFQDILLQYTRREATDLRAFLEWWDEKKDKQYLTMPDGQDAIRLITIHKSKGLEFDAVIIPFCDWPLAKEGRILWCQPEKEPFNDMQLLPLKFEQALRNTIFVKDYLREKMLSYIDNLNLLYVAFTRARKSLFVYTPYQEKESFTTVKDLLRRIWHQPEGDVEGASVVSDRHYIDLAEHWDTEAHCFELGTLSRPETKRESTANEQAAYFDSLSRRSWNYVAHVTRNSAYFTSGKQQNVQMDKGRLLHDVFRNIVTTTDLERCLNGLIVEGKLSESERTHLAGTIRLALQDPVVNRWFSPDVRVKTETDILLPDGTIARPDRMVFDETKLQVIDYKFGEQESPGYQRQVLYYMRHLKDMGYTFVEGFLWYVTLNKVLKVNQN